MAKMSKNRKSKKKTPEALISLAEYEDAPIGTVVGSGADGCLQVFLKVARDYDCPDCWETTNSTEWYSSRALSGVDRIVLRYGKHDYPIHE